MLIHSYIMHSIDKEVVVGETPLNCSKDNGKFLFIDDGGGGCNMFFVHHSIY